jgi:hypothetical protein
MRLSRFFITRPIFAAVIAIVITIVGAIAYLALPVSQYPDIVPPTVTVTATYPGASAETVAETVAAPIEQEINGVDNMLYQSSQSTGDGNVTITVTFKQGTDLDAAQVLVQNRVASPCRACPKRCSARRRHAQDLAGLPDGRQPDLARQLARSRLHLQLCADQVRDRSPDRRRGRRALFGSARLCDARLDRSRPRRRARPDRGRDRRGAARAERAGRRRHARPAALRQRQRLPAQCRDAGPPDRSPSSSPMSSSAPTPTAARSASPTSAGSSSARRLRPTPISRASRR